MSSIAYKKLPLGAQLYMSEDLDVGERGKAWYQDEEFYVYAREQVRNRQGVIVIDDGNGVRPDYAGEVLRGVSIPAYKLMSGEVQKWMYIIAVESPGSLTGTRLGIPAGDEVDLIDAETGNSYLECEAGYDYLIKMVWISFDQRVRWQIYCDYVADYICDYRAEAYCDPLQNWLIGWRRTYLEPIGETTKARLRIKNLGSSTAYGKAWVVAFVKKGAYEWL